MNRKRRVGSASVAGLSRSRYQRRRRGNSRYLVIFLLLVGFAAGLFFGGKILMQRVTYFNIARITIEGQREIPMADYRKALEPLRGRNLFTVTGRDASRLLKSLARVNEVNVGWSLPDGIKVTVTERCAAFQIKTVEGDVFPIDREGVVLNRITGGPVEDAPLIDVILPTRSVVPGITLKSNTVTRAIKLHEKINQADRKFADRISEYYDRNGEIYFVEGDSGARVILGEENISEKLPRLVFYAENIGFTPNQTVDLRFKDQIVMRTGE
jgi:cell division protein FtsQ